MLGSRPFLWVTTSSATFFHHSFTYFSQLFFILFFSHVKQVFLAVRLFYPQNLFRNSKDVEQADNIVRIEENYEQIDENTGIFR